MQIHKLFRTKKAEIITYICEICGKKSKNYNKIQNCEQLHKEAVCNHEYLYSMEFEYDGGCYGDDRYANGFSIIKYCKNCNKKYSVVSIDQYHNNIPKIYEVLSGEGKL